MKEYKKNFAISSGLITALLTTLSSNASEALAPPEYSLVDRFSVNMATGQVQFEQTPVELGGELGVGLTVSTYSSDFYNIVSSGVSVQGFSDSNRGAIYGTVLSKNSLDNSKWVYGVKVFGFGYSGTFRYDNGQFMPFQSNTSNRLEYDSSTNSYVFTAKDGARLFFTTQRYDSSSVKSKHAILNKIIYPNGFTKEISSSHNGKDAAIHSVTTNTGYQLKYSDTAGSASGSTPTSVQALNTVYESCPTTSSVCSPNMAWPKAKFNWPEGFRGSNLDNSPVVMNGNTEFKITDAEGRETVYRHKPYRASDYGFNDNNTYYDLPRITEVKQAGTTIAEYEYEFLFRNKQFSYAPFFSVYSIVAGFPAVVSATMPDSGSQDYAMGQMGQNGATVVNASGTDYLAVNSYQSTNYGTPTQVYTWDKTIIYNYQPRYDANSEVISYFSELDFITDLNGKRMTFTYDGRGNVTSKTYLGSTVSAGYPTTCSNLKTCNKPLWVKDARGNKTDYSYHAESGNVQTKTAPPDSNGIRPQTRFTYLQYRAVYLNGQGEQVVGSPVWLLSSESFCINSAYTNGSCNEDDEVVTTFEYDESENLRLKGMKTTSNGQHRLTCYEYDKFGNRIGELLPKANMSSCI